MEKSYRKILAFQAPPVYTPAGADCFTPTAGSVPVAWTAPPIYTASGGRNRRQGRQRPRRGGRVDIVQRAKAMILTPAAEWRAIEPESGDAGYLFANYVGILAAIPPVCEFLRYGVFGWGSRYGFHHFHHGGFSSLFGGLVHYLMTFVVVYAMAVI